MTTNNRPPVSRRQALYAITGISALMHGRVDAQRRLVLPLDGLEGILVQYQGRSVLVPSSEILAALISRKDA